MTRSVRPVLSALAVALMALSAVQPATATTAKKKPAAKPAAAAAATTTTATLSSDQLAVAGRVNTGVAECEFSQKVDVQPVSQHQGYFNVGYNGKTYLMAPENTTTGAVRLEDKKNGVMWLQIANKSMLMNSKAGQRMVDNCTHPVQRG